VSCISCHESFHSYCESWYSHHTHGVWQLDTVYQRLENATQVALESAFNDQVRVRVRGMCAYACMCVNVCMCAFIHDVGGAPTQANVNELWASCSNLSTVIAESVPPPPFPPPLPPSSSTEFLCISTTCRMIMCACVCVFVCVCVCVRVNVSATPSNLTCKRI